jgi:hypothetical protein
MARPLQLNSVIAAPAAPGAATSRSHNFERGSKLNRTLLWGAACCIGLLAAHAQAAETFPRTAAYLIGNPRNYEDAAYQAKIAKVDIAIVSVWTGWEKDHGMTIEQVTQRLKALNPNIKVFHYFLPESLRYPVNPAVADLGAKLDTEKWWLYTSGSGSTKVLSDFGNDTYVINVTSFTPADASGKRSNQWLAEYAYKTKAQPNPSMDGIFTDNVFWKPRRDGDWNRDGTIDSQNSTTVRKYYREGYAVFLNKLKQLMPGKLQIANIADWGHADAVLTEYDQILNGGIMEGMIGESWSPERQGWSVMLSRYRKSMAALAPPKLGILHQFGSSTDFRGMRYGLATTLLDDGYYAFTDEVERYSGVVWFDELDQNLGSATGAPPTVAWQNGVWRRDFERGIALVNPKGNGTREITLEGDYRKIAGTQDRTVNNGQVVRKVTLGDRDGIVLLRLPKRPRPPQRVHLIPPG